MSDDYLWNRSGPPHPEVEKLEQLLAPLRHDAPLDELRLRRPHRSRTIWIVATAGIAAAAAVALYFALPGKPRPPGCAGTVGFSFIGRGGEVTCGGTSVAAGVLPVGGSLDTGAHEAELAIATIGQANLGPNTRVRLEETSTSKHHLALDRGKLHAKVNAPPRLFEVSTPHADVVDLGCEYEIEIDDKGAGSIAVLHGQVELATKTKLLVIAPMNTHARIYAGNRPGVPLSGKNVALAKAIDAYEHGAPTGLDAALAAAEAPDAISIIALAAIESGAVRAKVLARLAEISPPPDDVTVEAAVAGGKPFETWQRDVVDTYFGLWR